MCFVQVAIRTLIVASMGHASRKTCNCNDGYQGNVCEIAPGKYNIYVMFTTNIFC